MFKAINRTKIDRLHSLNFSDYKFYQRYSQNHQKYPTIVSYLKLYQTQRYVVNVNNNQQNPDIGRLY